MNLLAEHAAWLLRRGIRPEIADAYGLRSELARPNGRHRSGIAIPYRINGKEITTKVRWIDCGEPNWTHAGGGEHLWNEDAIIDPQHAHMPILVSEGEWDALAAISSGYFRTVSVPCGASGKFNVNGQVATAIKDCKKVVLCGDNDDAGRECNIELLRRLGAQRCWKIDYPDGRKDLNEILQFDGVDAVRNVIETSVRYPIAGLLALDDYPDVERAATLSTGWRNLDGHFKLWRSEFCVITGIPQHGKSRFALDLMCALNRHHQHRAVIASFETPIVPHVRDIFREHYCNKPRHELTEEDKARADVWSGRFAYFIDADAGNNTEQASLEWVIQRAEDAVFRHAVDWLLIDPWNQMDHLRERFETELDYQQRAIRAFKKFRRAYDCGVILVVHPTKAVLDSKTGKVRRPTLYDCSGGSHWYSAADHGLIIWRDHMASSHMSVTCAKSRYRDGGMPGEAFLTLHNGRFEPLEAAKGPLYSLHTPDQAEQRH